MVIRSDKHEFEMSAWLLEKSTKSLRSALGLADWLNTEAHALTDTQVEAFEADLYRTVSYLVTITTFAADSSPDPIVLSQRGVAATKREGRFPHALEA